MKADHIKTELCTGTLEGCSDPDHLPYDEMRSTLDNIIEAQEKIERGSSEYVFQIEDVIDRCAPYNISDKLKQQVVYQQVVVIKSKVINSSICFAPPPLTKARNDVFCCGTWCYNQEAERANHALGWTPADYKDARGVICLVCPDDYWMSKNRRGYLDRIAMKCLDDIKLQKRK